MWHVADLKVSHKDDAVITYFTQELGRRNRDKLRIKRGKVFYYLGMDLEFESCPGTMIISMIKYLDAMFEEWPEELKGHIPIPHQDHLFEVRADDDPKKALLNKEMALQFHHTTTAQLLFLCLRARPDIQTAVSFFTTRTRNPDTDDWNKLRHCMRYLKSIRYMKRQLSANNLTDLMWWADGSYGVHWDSKDQTEAMMSMDKGAIHSKCVKETQAQCGKLDRIITSKYCRCIGSDDMVQVLHGGAGLHY